MTSAYQGPSVRVSMVHLPYLRRGPAFNLEFGIVSLVINQVTNSKLESSQLGMLAAIPEHSSLVPITHNQVTNNYDPQTGS